MDVGDSRPAKLATSSPADLPSIVRADRIDGACAPVGVSNDTRAVLYAAVFTGGAGTCCGVSGPVVFSAGSYGLTRALQSIFKSRSSASMRRTLAGDVSHHLS